MKLPHDDINFQAVEMIGIITWSILFVPHALKEHETLATERILFLSCQLLNKRVSWWLPIGHQIRSCMYIGNIKDLPSVPYTIISTGSMSMTFALCYHKN